MQISVTMDPRSPLTGVPDDAPIVASSRTWDLFGVDVQGESEPKLTWGELRSRLLNLAKDGRLTVPWMDKVERDICKISEKGALGKDDVSFVSGQDVWRPIAVSQDILRSGQRRISVQFVPVIERQFPGLPKTSRLLGSVVMSSRYHFRYIEGWNEFSRAFSPHVPAEDFISACQQLLLDLKRIEHEGLELGVGDLEALIRAFGEDNRVLLTNVFQLYFSERQTLSRTLAEVKKPLDATVREQAVSAVEQFFNSTRENNFRFLSLAIELYKNEISGSKTLLEGGPLRLTS